VPILGWVKTQAGRRSRKASVGTDVPEHAARRNGSRPDSLPAELPAERPDDDLTGNLAVLLAEAQAAVSTSANVLRDVRERYRAAYLEQFEHWQRLREMLAGGSKAAGSETPAKAAGGGEAAVSGTPATAVSSDSLRRDEAVASQEVGAERSALARIELAVKSLENAWLFLAREDNSLVGDLTSPASPADLQMRIVEAQEAERSRLAREVHDGPAQALSNAIFQVEVVQRLLDRDEAMARAELQGLRNVLTRELRGVRAYLSQLRPPLLADLGLSGAINDAADQIGAALDIPVVVELDDGVDNLPETVEVVILRVVQEALQNARKHAAPTEVRVRVESEDGGGWVVEVRDDGRGFDIDRQPDGPQRNFGLHFMRERADRIGGRFEVRSGEDLGTVVRLSIPPGAMGMPIPGEVPE
jgi:two-component system, NarL family, sensor histidine kinase DegS